MDINALLEHLRNDTFKESEHLRALRNYSSNILKLYRIYISRGRNCRDSKYCSIFVYLGEKKYMQVMLDIVKEFDKPLGEFIYNSFYKIYTEYNTTIQSLDCLINFLTSQEVPKEEFESLIQLRKHLS